MSREEREDRARLKGGSIGARWRQFEETGWGRALLIFGVCFFTGSTIWLVWSMATKFSEGRYSDTWTLIWDAALSLLIVWGAVRALCELLIAFRKAKQPVTTVKADPP